MSAVYGRYAKPRQPFPWALSFVILGGLALLVVFVWSTAVRMGAGDMGFEMQGTYLVQWERVPGGRMYLYPDGRGGTRPMFVPGTR